jgi:hypothetical protein
MWTENTPFGSSYIRNCSCPEAEKSRVRGINRNTVKMSTKIIEKFTE